MLHFDDIVFGPIHSRRLGSSLGINLLPHDGKLCNFDCIYCECGWNRDGRVRNPVLPAAEDVMAALEARLSQCRDDGTHIDSITFSGNGEADPMSKLLCGLLGSVYEFERNLIVQRVREGCAIAHAAGKYKNVGRKPTLSADTITELRKRHAAGARPTDLAKIYEISRATVYNYLSKTEN